MRFRRRLSRRRPIRGRRRGSMMRRRATRGRAAFGGRRAGFRM